MRDTITKGLIFVAGVGTGIAASMYFIKKKYECIAEEEIEKARQLYKKRAEKVKVEIEEPEKKTEESSEPVVKEDYNKIVEDLGYKKKEETMDTNLPYVIEKDEYGEMADYELVHLSYYKDGVLEDTEGNLIEDISYHIGWDGIDALESHTEETVFVRNDNLKKDFEIFLEDYNYYDED